MSLFEGSYFQMIGLRPSEAFCNLELTEGANTVISFYSVSLGSCVGSHFRNPSIELLGGLWFEASSTFTIWSTIRNSETPSDELRSSIRTLFDATVANLSDEEAIRVTEKWQHHGAQIAEFWKSVNGLNILTDSPFIAT